MDSVYLSICTREELRLWYEQNSRTAKEVWIKASRSWIATENQIKYIDAVEVALCFGWIDSTSKSISGIQWSRFSPRRAKSNWTELNKARCRRLIRLGEMTEQGMKVLPSLNKNEGYWREMLQHKELEPVLPFLELIPPLYTRIRLYNIWFTLNIQKNKVLALKQIAKFTQATMEGRTYGEWNDHGRLADNE